MKIKTIVEAPWQTSLYWVGCCSGEQALPLILPTEPYTVREARIHVRHVRDLLKSLDPSDAFNGVDCNSLSFLSVFTDGDLGGAGGIGTGGWAEDLRADWPGAGEGAMGRAFLAGGGRAGGIQTGAILGGEIVGPRVALC